MRLDLRLGSTVLVFVAFGVLVGAAWWRTTRATTHDHGAESSRVGGDGVPSEMEVARADVSPEGQLVLAAAEGDLGRIRDLLGEGVSPEARNSRGRQPLHFAAAFGQPEAVRLLAAEGAGLDGRDEIGWSPLTWAAWQGSLEGTRTLIALGADPDARYPPNHVTPLAQLMAAWHMAEDGAPEAPPPVLEQRAAIARVLFEAGADPNIEGGSGLPLDIALFLEDPTLIALFFDHGARIGDLWSAKFFIRQPGPIGDLVRAAAEREGLSESEVLTQGGRNP